MRDDIIGMLKNAIDHGGNPQRVAQSLINSGYPMKDVKEAYDYLMVANPELAARIQQSTQQVNQATPQIQISSEPQQVSRQPTQPPQSSPQKMSMPQAPQYKAPAPQLVAPLQLIKPKPLPSQKTNPQGSGKIIILVVVLILLIISLISVIVFKDNILDLLSL